MIVQQPNGYLAVYSLADGFLEFNLTNLEAMRSVREGYKSSVFAIEIVQDARADTPVFVETEDDLLEDGLRRWRWCIEDTLKEEGEDEAMLAAQMGATIPEHSGILYEWRKEQGVNLT